MTNTEATQIIIDRANEMLKNDKIKKVYQSFPDKDVAQAWIIKAAITTLFGIN